MGWGGHRSRSPKNKDSTLQWISKKLAVLGRYSDKRPHGLHVDGNGTLSLTNLMECWGNSQGVSEDDVLNAVRTNMTCARTGRPRFALSGNSHTGEWHITVHESGGGWGGGGGGSAGKAETWHEAKSNNSYGNGKSYGYDYDKNDYSNSYGNNSYSDQNQWQSSGQSDNWQSTTSTSSPGWRFQRGADTSAAPTQKDHWKQPTPAPQTQQNVKAQSWRLQGGGGGQWRGKDEQCTRLLGFILKNSYGEDAVNVDREGWAAMEDCVAVMQNKKPDLGINSVDDLKQLLQNCDHEGRFAIDEYNRVRKVDRADRQAAAHPAYPPSKPAPTTTWTTQKQHKTSGPFNAFTGSKQEPEEQKAWVKEEPEQVDYGGDDDEEAGKEKKGPPRVPPGKGWEMYDDDGVSWWYYEGPRGKWWMQDGQTTPQPWDEGTEES